MRILFSFILMTFGSLCIAQSSPEAVSAESSNCEIITVSSELDTCVNNNMLASNTSISIEFVNIEERIHKIYEGDIALGKLLIKKVRKTQDAWEHFRELNCSLVAFEIEEGTSAYITIINNCIINMNKSRISDLRKLLN